MNPVSPLNVVGLPDTTEPNCTDPPIGSLLLDYARDLLADTKKARAFEKHVAHCSACEKELTEWNRFFETVGGCSYEKEPERPEKRPNVMAAGASYSGE